MADAKKPNILVIMSDDIGIWNISAYHRGMMGGRTPKTIPQVWQCNATIPSRGASLHQHCERE